MPDDDFTEAARAEAFRVWFEEPTTLDTISDLGAHMAEWARVHLAAQEPTDAEVEALVDSLDWAIRGTTDGDRIDQDSELPVGEVVRLIHEGARAALSAARAARRDEEAGRCPLTTTRRSHRISTLYRPRGWLCASSRGWLLSRRWRRWRQSSTALSPVSARRP